MVYNDFLQNGYNILDMTIREMLILNKELNGQTVSVVLNGDDETPYAGLFITTDSDLIKQISALADGNEPS